MRRPKYAYFFLLNWRSLCRSEEAQYLSLNREARNRLTHEAENRRMERQMATGFLVVRVADLQPQVAAGVDVDGEDPALRHHVKVPYYEANPKGKV